MRNRSDDLRNILLIAGAGAVGVLGTLFVTSATERPSGGGPDNAREQAVVVEASSVRRKFPGCLGVRRVPKMVWP